MASEVNEQGHVAVGEGRRDALAAQRLEARRDVGPGVQPVPRAHEPTSRLDREVHAPLGEEIVERHVR